MTTFDRAVLAVVEAHGTQRVWHYTRCSALASIVRQSAIYSRAELIRLGIPFDPTHYYGTERHEELLGDYVSCAPLPPWGMMQSETEEIAVLELHPAVIAISGACFCPGWSPRGDFDPDEIVTWTGPDRLEGLYTGPGPMMVNPCECFVPKEIPLSAVRNIVFFGEESRNAAEPALQEAAKATDDDQTIGLLVNPARFPRTWQASGPPWEGDDAPKL